MEEEEAMSGLHEVQLYTNNVLTGTWANITRTAVLYDVNLWFYQYFTMRDGVVKQLPPLDDWTMDKEQYNAWSVAFPFPEWTITLTERM
jgi:hypothetical protein